MTFPRRTAQGLIDAAAGRLEAFPNGELDAELLFRGVSGLDRASLFTSRGTTVEEDVARRFEAALLRREHHEPVQYILGTAAFWRDEFVVNRAVLIPRPETEILVEAVASDARAAAHVSILDMGTGSGCIALSLLRELPDARATAVDVSREALEVARENARRLLFESRIEFRLSRWFESLETGKRFDVIVSNPPYVALSDRAALPRDVSEFEPSMALFADPEDDLSSYRALVAGLDDRLNPSGLVAFEVGAGQARGVADLLRSVGLARIEIRNDLAGIERVVLAKRL